MKKQRAEKANSVLEMRSAVDVVIAGRFVSELMNGRGRTSVHSAVYRVGVTAVAIIMVLLPCAYLALVVFAGSGVIFWMSGGFPAFWGQISQILLSGASLPSHWSTAFGIAGLSFTVCMLKPIFARTVAPPGFLKLNAKQEPAFFAFVQQICKAIGAPVPSSIELSCEVNVSACFASGVTGFAKRRLILTIGMPLVLSLTQRELAGVIAHECAYFRHGMAMRLTFLMRSINRWFDRAVNDRDSWDETIALMLESRRPVLIGLGAAARAGAEISRFVLRILMWSAHTVSLLPVRTIQRGADRAQLRVAGTSAFVSTTYKLACLEAVSFEIMAEMHELWRKRLVAPENLPELIVERDALLSPHARLLIGAQLELAPSSLQDPCPSHGDRIRLADAVNARGLPLKDGSADKLLVNPSALSRQATEIYFKAYVARWRAQRAREARISRAA